MKVFFAMELYKSALDESIIHYSVTISQKEYSSPLLAGQSVLFFGFSFLTCLLEESFV